MQSGSRPDIHVLCPFNMAGILINTRSEVWLYGQCRPQIIGAQTVSGRRAFGGDLWNQTGIPSIC